MRNDFFYLDMEDREKLNHIVNCDAASPHIQKRAQILLLADQGLNNSQIGIEVGMNRCKAANWIERYKKRDAGTPINEVLKNRPKNHYREIPLEAYQWVRDLVAEHGCKTILEATELVNREAETAGYPRLAIASYSKIRAILKSK